MAGSNNVTKATGKAVGKLEKLTGTILACRDDIIARLAGRMDPDTFLAMALDAIENTRDRNGVSVAEKCEPGSVIRSVMKASSVGLSLDRFDDEAYLVPFGAECTLISGYKGLLKLARRNQGLRTVKVVCVYDADHFVIEQGTEDRIIHSPEVRGPRGPIIGAYSVAKLATGETDWIWMRIDEIEAIRQSSKSKDSPAWTSAVGYPEMCRKTVLRRHLKHLPRGAEVDDRLRAEDEDDGPIEVRTVATPPKSLETVTNRLRIGNGIPDGGTVEDGGQGQEAEPVAIQAETEKPKPRPGDAISAERSLRAKAEAKAAKPADVGPIGGKRDEPEHASIDGPAGGITLNQIDKIEELREATKYPAAAFLQILKAEGVANVESLSEKSAAMVIDALQSRLDEMEPS